MKIEFDPSVPEEREEIKHLLKAGEYLSALDEIYQMCRSQLKHGESLGEKADHLLEEIKRISGSELN
jgi:hypothetical protein